MEKYLDILNRTYFDNTIGAYLSFGTILFLGIIFKRFFSKLSSKVMFEMFRNKALGISQKDLYNLVRKPVSMFILLIFIYLAFSILNYPTVLHLAPREQFGLKMIIDKLYLSFFIISLINIFRKLIDFLGIVLVKRAEEKESKSEKQLIPFAIDSLKIIVLILGIFIMLGSVFKINVGTLIAGLGIGGLAVALAAKESLENLMGSFTIFIDKPFVTGDLIKVGETEGVVEKVGFRSTRIRTLDKTFVTVPNKNMVNFEVDNFTERNIRRVKFELGLRYNTTIQQLNNIMQSIHNYIVNHPDTTEDCFVKFAEFGSSSLNILVLYYINNNDYAKFLDIREDINFKIMELVQSNNADFAFPSTSIYMEKK